MTVDLWDLRLQSDSNPISPPQCHMVITALPCSTTFPCQQLHPPPPFDSLRYRHIACILPCLSLISLPYRAYVLSKNKKCCPCCGHKNICPLFLTPHSSPRPSPVPTCAYLSILHPSLSSSKANTDSNIFKVSMAFYGLGGSGERLHDFSHEHPLLLIPGAETVPAAEGEPQPGR